MLLRADYILPVVGPVCADAAVLIEDGRILAVDRADRLSAQVAEPVQDLGSVVIMPGLVNAHSHLELTALRDAIAPGKPFVDWIREIIRLKPTLNPKSYADGAKQGAAEALESGTTTVGDIVSVDGVVEALADSPLRRVSYWETLGIGPRSEGAIDTLRGRLDAHRSGPRVRFGVAPHAPYSTSPEVYRAALQLAHERGLPSTTHLAETTEEIEYLELGTGPFRGLLLDLGLIRPSEPAAGMSPREFLESVGGLTEGMLVAHMNHPLAGDAAALAASGCSVAFCPGAHAYFGRGRHPFRDLIDAGVNVALGTDSAAGNQRLSILAEMRAVFRAQRSLWPQVILRMATLNGAAALGMGETVGALAAGYAADLVAVPLRRNGPADPLENVLAGDEPPSLVMIAGRAVGGRGSV